jgi:tetratricopeptide (TPR) repeat protein
MKRILVVVIIGCFTSLLLAQHGGGDFEKLMKYQQEPSFDNLDVALEYYQNLMETEEKEIAQIALANIHMMAFNNVIDDMKTDLDSLTMRSKFQLANLLLENNRFAESIEIYNNLNSSAPKWSCAWRHKGEALLKMNMLDDAEKATFMAIETREDHYDAYIQLAEIQKKLGKYKTALETLNTSSKYASSDTEEEVDPIEVQELKAEIESLINNN